MSLNTLTEWMAFLSGPDRQYEEDALSVDVYGEGDDSYLVLEKEIEQSPIVVEQYVLHPLSGDNKLYQQIQFLAECQFSLSKIVDRLVNAKFLETKMNEVVRFSTVEVAHYRLRENRNPQ